MIQSCISTMIGKQFMVLTNEKAPMSDFDFVALQSLWNLDTI